MALRRLGSIHFALATRIACSRPAWERACAPFATGSIRVDSTPTWMVSPCLLAQTPGWHFPGLLPGRTVPRAPTASTCLGWRRASGRAWPVGTSCPRLPGQGSDEDTPEGARVSIEEFKRGQTAVTQWKAGQVAYINETLARQLAARKGDEIILRVRKPSALGLDAAISPRNEDTVALRLKVGAVLTPDMLGDFALAAQPAPPANLFLPLEFLADKVNVHDQANLLVIGRVISRHRSLGDGITCAQGGEVVVDACASALDKSTPRMSAYCRPDPSSRQGTGRRLKPRRERPIPDQLTRPGLQNWPARGRRKMPA